MSEQSAEPAQPKQRIDWGNAPQWVSAVCALAIAALAVWGIFFSQTSQALVSYLQSELAVRNQRIAALELRERDLQLSISLAQNSLGGLIQQKQDLEQQVASLKSEQESLATKVAEMGRILSATEFNLVREKLAARQASILGNVYAAILGRMEKDKARKIRVFDLFLKDIEGHAAELTESEKVLARVVIENFKRQCAKLSETVITAAGIDSGERNIKIAQTIETCFRAFTPDLRP